MGILKERGCCICLRTLLFFCNQVRCFVKSTMELIWDPPDTSLECTVDAHIKNIRAKLRRIAPEREAIVTHRGSGYALREEP